MYTLNANKLFESEKMAVKLLNYSSCGQHHQCLSPQNACPPFNDVEVSCAIVLCIAGTKSNLTSWKTRVKDYTNMLLFISLYPFHWMTTTRTKQTSQL